MKRREKKEGEEMGMRVWNQCKTKIIAILYDKKNASNFKIKHCKRLEYLLVSCFDKRKSKEMTTCSAILLHILSIIYHIILCDSISCNIRVPIEKIWFEYNKYPILSYPIVSYPILFIFSILQIISFLYFSPIYRYYRHRQHWSQRLLDRSIKLYNNNTFQITNDWKTRTNMISLSATHVVCLHLFS